MTLLSRGKAVVVAVFGMAGFIFVFTRAHVRGRRVLAHDSWLSAIDKPVAHGWLARPGHKTGQGGDSAHMDVVGPGKVVGWIVIFV